MKPKLAADTVRVRRVLAAPVAAVWRAWTDPALAARWSWGAAFDTVSISLDCRPGGAWRQHIRNRETGENYFFDGVFEAVEPRRRLVHTFHFRSERGKDEETSLVEIRFADADGGTAVTIVHSRLAKAHMKETQEGWVDVLARVAAVAADEQE
jgi:uncharacterized protein YndB with AHSA1/START domain